MNVFRAIIETAVGSAIAEHPKYFTPKGTEKAKAAIVRRIMAALREDENTEDAPETTEQPFPFIFADADSAAAKGYVNLRRLAGATDARRTADGKTVVKREADCPAVCALAELPSDVRWLFLTAPQQIRAWMDFFRDMLGDTGRRSIAETCGGQTGIFMPYPFPPSKTGKIYDPEYEDQEESAA